MTVALWNADRERKDNKSEIGGLGVASVVETGVMWSDLGFVEHGQTWLALLHESVFAALELSQDEKITRGEREGEFRQRDENRLDLWHRRTMGETRRELGEGGARKGGMEKRRKKREMCDWLSLCESFIEGACHIWYALCSNWQAENQERRGSVGGLFHNLIGFYKHNLHIKFISNYSVQFFPFFSIS